MIYFIGPHNKVSIISHEKIFTTYPNVQYFSNPKLLGNMIVHYEESTKLNLIIIENYPLIDDVFVCYLFLAACQ